MRICLTIALLVGCAAGVVLAQAKNFHGQDITGVPKGDFTDQDCSGADFSQARLYSVQFIRTNLRGANFQKATISGGTFAFADLENADFTDADLHTASLADAKNLAKAIFRNAKLYDLSDADFSGADLRGQNLVQARMVNTKLRGANLSHCNLSQADLTNADLRDADLTAADLTQAQLWNADLRGADLTNATITQMNVRGADLTTVKGLDPDRAGDLLAYPDPPRLPEGFPTVTGTTEQTKTLQELLSQPDMNGSDLRKMNLEGADLRQARMQGSRLPASVRNALFKDADASSVEGVGTDFGGADLDHANLRGAWLVGAKMGGAKNLGGADLGMCRMEQADLSNAGAAGAKLSGAYLRGANLSHADLHGADLSLTCLIGANLSGANLSGAKINEANFAGADISGAIFSQANADESWGLSEQQLKTAGAPPQLLPLRLDPARRAALAQQSSAESSSDGDQDSVSSSPFIPGWQHNPILIRKALIRLGIGLAVTALLIIPSLLGALAGMADPSNGDPDAPFQAAFHSQMKIPPRGRTAPEPQKIGSFLVWPPLNEELRENRLPLRLIKPPTFRPRAAALFVLINGVVISLLIASLAITISPTFALVCGAIWMAIFCIWLLVLVIGRGRLIVLDRSQVLTAVMKLSNPTRLGRMRSQPTSSFTAVSWFYSNTGSPAFRDLELNGGGLGRRAIALGSYPTEQAFALRKQLASLLRIADRDETRRYSSD